jgi:hypothetical protein
MVVARVMMLMFAIGLILALAGPVNAVGSGKNEPAKNPTELEKALLKAARETYEFMQQEVDVGKRLPTEDMCWWSHRWLEAQLAVTSKQPDRLAAYKAHEERLKPIEKFMKTAFDAGKISRRDYMAVKYFHIQAKIWLAREQAKK